MPREFYVFLMHCRQLDFYERPDYNYLESLLRNVAQRQQINLDDNIYDWGLTATAMFGTPNSLKGLERKEYLRKIINEEGGGIQS